jgi:hypothetical protein
MGIVASLFFTNDSEKQTLHRRIIPTDEQRESQKKRWNDLAEYLKEQLREDSAYPIYSWLQGSYKFATQLRPLMENEEFDIDWGFTFSGQVNLMMVIYPFTAQENGSREIGTIRTRAIRHKKSGIA